MTELTRGSLQLVLSFSLGAARKKTARATAAKRPCSPSSCFFLSTILVDISSVIFSARERAMYNSCSEFRNLVAGSSGMRTLLLGGAGLCINTVDVCWAFDNIYRKKSIYERVLCICRIIDTKDIILHQTI